MSRQQVPNRELAADVARLNLLTNPGFEIWQRGVGPYTAGGVYTADRWLANLGGGSTHSVSRVGSGMGSYGYSMQVVYTHAAGGYGQYTQKFEDSMQLRVKSVTASMLVKCTLVGAANFRLVSQPGGVIVGNKTNTTTAEENLWFTGTVPADCTALNLEVILSVGSCTAEFNDTTFVRGTTPMEYQPLHPADDLTRCLRYYERMGFTAAAYPMLGCNLWNTGAGGLVYWNYDFQVRKAVSPTVTVTAGWQAVNYNQPYLHSTNQDGFLWQAVAIASGGGYVHATASSGCIAEANP